MLMEEKMEEEEEV